MARISNGPNALTLTQANQRAIASQANARPTLGGFPGATAVSNLPGAADAAGGSCAAAAAVDGELFALPMTLNVAAATTTVPGTATGNFITIAANPAQINVNQRIPNDYNVYESQLFVSTGVGAAQTETLAGLNNWVIQEMIAGVEQNVMPLSKFGLIYNVVGALTNGGASSTYVVPPEGMPYRRTYNPTVNYSLNLVPQGPAITTVSAIEFCLVLYGTRGGTGVGPFTGLR